MPARSARVAWVWRRSCRRIVGSAALLDRLTKEATHDLGVQGLAVLAREDQARVRPALRHRLLHKLTGGLALSTSTVAGSRATTLRPRAVLGSQTTTSLPLGISARLTESDPASRSTSSQVRRQRLASPHAGQGQQVPEGIEAIVSGRLKERRQLFGAPGLHLVAGAVRPGVDRPPRWGCERAGPI